MYQKILVAYDGSPLSYQAIESAKHYAEQNDGSIVHIISVVRSTGPATNIHISETLSNELIEQYRPQMEKIKEGFEEKNISVITNILQAGRNDKIGKHICDYAKNNSIDVIVMGSRGLGKIQNFFLGSVSNNVVQHAECPVFIIK